MFFKRTLISSLGLWLLSSGCAVSFAGEPLYSSTRVGSARMSVEMAIPSPDRGNQLMTWARDERSVNEIDQSLKQMLGLTGSSVLIEKVKIKASAETALQSDHPSDTIYSLNAYFPVFVREHFNRGAGFSGPNCYNTALLNTGLMKSIRYVSPEEFELRLGHDFEKIASPDLPGDVVVYDASRTRGHVATVLLGNLVFHKKSYPRGYLYRVTGIDDVFAAEPFEWQPRWDSDFRLWNPSREELNDRQFYRVRKVLPKDSAPVGREALAVDVVEYALRFVVQNAPDLKIGEVLGYASEGLSAELMREFEFLKNSTAYPARLAYAELVSVHDQIFQSIDERYFSSPYSAGRAKEIYQQICYQEGEYLHGIVARVLKYLGKPFSDSDVNRVITRLKQEDRRECDRIQLLQLIKET